MQYGFALSKRFGPGFRRNVRFDDTAQSFCIDVCLPGKNTWESVDYETAYQDVKGSEVEARKLRGESLSGRAKAASATSADIVDITATGKGQATGGILKPPTLPAPSQGHEAMSQDSGLFAWGRNK